MACIYYYKKKHIHIILYIEKLAEGICESQMKLDEATTDHSRIMNT